MMQITKIIEEKLNEIEESIYHYYGTANGNLALLAMF